MTKKWIAPYQGPFDKKFAEKLAYDFIDPNDSYSEDCKRVGIIDSKIRKLPKKDKYQVYTLIELEEDTE